MDSCRKRHRVADSKYRCKVQQLYGLLKEETHSPYPKDLALVNVQKQIRSLEEKLFSDHGLGNNAYKKEFLEILCQEEIIWNNVKDVQKWWLQVQDLITKIGSHQNPGALPAVYNICHEKPVESANINYFVVSADQNGEINDLLSPSKWTRKSKFRFAVKSVQHHKRNSRTSECHSSTGKCPTVTYNNNISNDD
ncbi:uncharacterized protein LOC118186686 [Stegodyphus dumicola]|uniref:uncharacterized protein LOC118186686 n=1 Tax=Stegodyphus dumicola TaxID=202533 RepID=UPI0015A9CD05|nr:uncharacterized protein LOC118186686 [Stegodyphus dumicola]